VPEFGWVFAWRVIGLGFGLLFNLMAARILGAGGVGVLLLGVGASSVLSLIALLGQDEVLTKWLATGVSPRRALKATGAIVFGMITLLVLVGFEARPLLPPPVRRLFVPVVCASASLAVLFWATGALRGLGRIQTFQVVRSLSPPVGGLAALLLAVGPTPQSALLGYAVGAASGAVVAFAALVNDSRWRLNIGANFGIIHALRMGGSLGTFAMGGVAQRWLDVFLLGLWWPPATVGVYGICSRISSLFGVFLNVAGNVVAPSVAARFAEGKLKSVSRHAISVARQMWVLSGPLVLVTLALPMVFLRLFGSDFASGANILRILVVGQSVNLLTGVTAPVLAMCSQEDVLRRIMLLSLTIETTIGFFVVRHLGSIGAAFLTATALASQNVAAWYAVRHKLNIRIDPFASWTDDSC